MPLNLPMAPGQYDATEQAQIRGLLEREDRRNQKIGGDVILRAPNGSLWKLVVNNSGALGTVAA
jgi:hypothetical protein